MPMTLLQGGQLAIRSIVFATDFSPTSQNAGLYAAALARHFQAELVVLHTYILSQGAREAELATQKNSVERLEHLQQLQDAASALESPAHTTRTQLIEGDPSEKIAAFADAIPTAMLVLGTHGGGTLERHLIGSVAERTLRRAATPTLTVGPLALAPEQHPFRSILYATDCSAMAAQAAPLACALASSFASELKVISVVDERAGATPDVLVELDFRTRQAISQQLTDACQHFTQPRALALARTARDEILYYADRSHSDLLILGVHRRAAIELFDRNSTTIQLIARAPCPVLTVTRDSMPGTTAATPHP